MAASKAPSVTVLIVSHNKPQLLPEAVESVLSQTMTDWQGVLIDSGTLHDQGYFARYPWSNDPRLRIVRSNETPELRQRKTMAPWCFNECFRQGWVHGELVMYLCDDDLLYPNAFATFVDAFQNRPEAMVMYASQDIGWLGTDGQSQIVGERRAIASGGKCCNGRIMDCQVDYLQLCHRRAALDVFDDTEYWPEAIATGDHADGLFMEKLGTYFEIFPIDVKVSQNRRTPLSVNLPVGDTLINFSNSSSIHESIMDNWTNLRKRLVTNSADGDLQESLDQFQSQLRVLCEQDYAQRVRLTSQRYRLADRVHAFLNNTPRTLNYLKAFSSILKQSK